MFVRIILKNKLIFLFVCTAISIMAHNQNSNRSNGQLNIFCILAINVNITRISNDMEKNNEVITVQLQLCAHLINDSNPLEYVSCIRSVFEMN